MSGPNTSIKCLQVNLNNCIAANATARRFLTEHQIDIALLQDAHCNKDGYLANFPKSWKVFPSNNKTAHIVIVNPNLIYSHVSTGNNSVFVSIMLSLSTIILGSVYAAPRFTLTDVLSEWKHVLPQTQPLLCGGDFNANSALWGCAREDVEGKLIQEFLLENTLTLANLGNQTPTFIKYREDGSVRGKGCPDLTILNTIAIQKLIDWKVIEEYNASDHRYITYTYSEEPILKVKKRFNTSRGKFHKFKTTIKAQKQILRNSLDNVQTVTDINTITNNIIDLIQQAAKLSFRQKSINKTHTFSFWNAELTKQRNHLTALRKLISRIAASDPDSPCLPQLNIKRKFITAKYRKTINETRLDAWKRFCSNETEKYGTLHKFFTGRYFTPPEILTNLSPESATRQASMEQITSAIFGPSIYPTNINQDIIFSNIQDKPFTKSELSSVFRRFNFKKAPGPDSIDFTMLKLAFDAIPNIFVTWANSCLIYGYFPEVLRRGEVIYFLKSDKDPLIYSSYRPICLLPTLGKLLEKLIVQRINYHLETNDLLHPRQFGFRANHSCDLALDTILNKCKENFSNNKYSTIVSLDIKGAFDNIEWHDILLQLKALSLPGNVAGVVRSYLSDRSVLLDWGAGSSVLPVQKGCPQGSCLGPILWLLVADLLLREQAELGHDLFAFADDFTFILSGRRRQDIEAEAEGALSVFSRRLDSLHLTLSPNKSFALTFSQPRRLSESRPPTIRVSGRSVTHVTSLKLLGIIIDTNLSWVPHIGYLRLKLMKFYHRSLRITAKTWGVNNSILKVWYLTIVERIITYGASVWGGSLSRLAKNKLISLQRLFLLQLSRGYKTISNEALNIITGIPPITLTLQYEFRKNSTLLLKKQSIIDTYFPNNDIQTKLSGWQIHPAEDTSDLLVDTSKNGFNKHFQETQIFTDGSKTENGVGSAYCVVRNGTILDSWSCKLNDNNTVYQAELFAVAKALDWIADNPTLHFVPIISDSMSGLVAISNKLSTHPLIVLIKLKILQLRNRTKLYHVSAHRGVFGNEAADELAKSATNDAPLTTDLPLPPSYVKFIFKQQLLSSWQEQWTASSKGRYTHSLLPHVSLKLLYLTPSTTCFLTGHGPFATYLHRFTIFRTDLCECGEVGSPYHMYTSCPLTAAWHLHWPQPAPGDWLTNVLSRKPLRYKLENIYKYLLNISNLT